MKIVVIKDSAKRKLKWVTTATQDAIDDWRTNGEVLGLEAIRRIEG